MLILQRYEKQIIMINDDIEIIVSQIMGREKSVKIGITAPEQYKIFRQELWLRIKQEQGVI